MLREGDGSEVRFAALQTLRSPGALQDCLCGMQCGPCQRCDAEKEFDGLLALSGPSKEPPPQNPRRLWLDNRATFSVVLDADDWEYFRQWLWAPKWNSRRKKVYGYRTIWRGSSKFSEYLHVAILRRANIRKPTAHHIIGNHINGDSLNCRKTNFRWATRSMNCRNLHGQGSLEG